METGGELSIQACVDILVEHTDGMRMRGWNVQDVCWNVQNIYIMRVGTIITWKSLSARHSGAAHDSVVSTPTLLTNDAIR